jgi:anti-sigma factor RsiW
MNCKAVSLRLDSYLDGELPGPEMISVRTHLNRCDACAEEAESLRSLKSALASLPCLSAPKGLEDRLVALVRKQASPLPVRSRRAMYWSAGIAAAACLGFALMAFAGKDEQPISASGNPNMDVARDQLYVTGADPLSGQTMVVPASYATGN